ncbi:MAG: DoxX family protein [Gemmatimonadaceae bacterium]|jgi:putative oxidoreductase|nr:DoxX family protein [Gemmatimonadaceae bacterium]
MAGRSREQQSLIAIRVAAAGTMLIHGLSRVSSGGVAPFGTFLGGVGFPQGTALAWTLTIVELIGGPLLLAGRFVRPLALFFVLELVAGIALVHGRAGWFVVGAGRNGMEYSAVLIIMLLAVAWSAGDTRRG